MIISLVRSNSHRAVRGLRYRILLDAMGFTLFPPFYLLTTRLADPSQRDDLLLGRNARFNPSYLG
jgi:hypothetical protein